MNKEMGAEASGLKLGQEGERAGDDLVDEGVVTDADLKGDKGGEKELGTECDALSRTERYPTNRTRGGRKMFQGCQALAGHGGAFVPEMGEVLDAGCGVGIEQEHVAIDTLTKGLKR